MRVVLATSDGPVEAETDTLFTGRVVTFGVPGAFTPKCSERHLPGYVEHGSAILAAGVARLVCLAVNDPFVLRAWARAAAIPDDITLLADGAGTFTHALGLELDLSARGFGVRSQRFAMISEDGRVTHLAVERPGELDVSQAEAILGIL